MDLVKQIAKGGELVFYKLKEGGFGCGVLSGFVPGTRKVVVSYGDCEQVVNADEACMASPRAFHPEAGYLVGQVFKDETEIAEKLLPLLKRKD